MIGVHPDDQVLALADYNLYTTDPALRRAVQRGGARWRDAGLVRQGAQYGAADTLRAGDEANRHAPGPEIDSPIGERIDRVRFHRAWHRMMALARRNGICNLPQFDPRASAWVAYGATLYMHCRVETGSTCPSTMTKAGNPLLRRNPELWRVPEPLPAAAGYDARDLPLTGKRSITVGMGMTEKQGGSDLRLAQRLVLTVQACLMLRHAGSRAAGAFIASRFSPAWGMVPGADCGTSDPAALLHDAWAA